ncbi:MAG: hypothetical protein A2Z74_03195 [Chloroflexi bacterium RBG_13_46_9]|nr:MAG: hypothetical protein A2Z74_03195 [Chloroflexi bacterium RBG_13_46_9]
MNVKTTAAPVTSQSILNLVFVVLVFGSLWGLSEVALGGSLRAAAFPYRSGLLTGIGMGVMGAALAMTRKWFLPVGIGMIAALVTLLVVPVLHASPICRANSCLALGLESGMLTLTALTIGNKANKSVLGLMAMGAGAALLASVAFYFTGIHLEPCAFLLSFTPGTFIITEGLIWAIFSAILLPIGYTIGERIAAKAVTPRIERNAYYYATGVAIIVACWGASAVAIAAGL